MAITAFNTGFSDTAAASVATGSLTFAVGDLVVVITANGDGNQQCNQPSFSFGTFAEVGSGAGLDGTHSGSRVWQVVCTSAGSGVITHTNGPGSNRTNFSGWIIPAGSHAGVGAFSFLADTTLTTSLAMTGKDSIVLEQITDWNASAAGRTGTPGGVTEDLDQQLPSTAYSAWAGHWEHQAGTVSYGVTGGGGTLTKMAVEVLVPMPPSSTPRRSAFQPLLAS